MLAVSPMITAPNAKSHLAVAGVMIAAGIAFGAALVLRGPAFVPAPVMAEQEVVMPEGHRFSVQRHEVTISEWNTCAIEGGCTLTLHARPDQDPAKTPATGLSFVDVQEYVAWINSFPGAEFRLPTAAEWDHMAAAVLPNEPEPLFTDPSLTWAATYLTEGTAPRALKPQGSFSTSPEGIVDLDGSVWEWTQECYVKSSAAGRCPAYFVGGEHVAAMSYLIRDPARGGCAVGTPPAHLGMRLVSDAPLRPAS